MQATHSTLQIPNDPTPWLLLEPSDNKDYCVLWLGGWGSTIEKHTPLVTNIAKRANVSIALPEYAGHGTHPMPLEQTTREQTFNEVVAAFDELKNLGYRNIIVAGMSFGSYMSALLTAERDPYAVILRGPAIYKDEEFSLPYPDRQGYRDQEYEAMKHTVSASSDMDALHAVASYDGSVYVVEHEVDSVIPQNIPRAYFSVAKRGNYLVIPAAEHAIAKMPQPERHYAYIEALIVNLIDLIKREETLPR